jgi:hypothetical protein
MGWQRQGSGMVSKKQLSSTRLLTQRPLILTAASAAVYGLPLLGQLLHLVLLSLDRNH